jgi:hypothetical protein
VATGKGPDSESITHVCRFWDLRHLRTQPTDFDRRRLGLSARSSAACARPWSVRLLIVSRILTVMESEM